MDAPIISFVIDEKALRRRKSITTDINTKSGPTTPLKVASVVANSPRSGSSANRLTSHDASEISISTAPVTIHAL
jgi:hypothetical protein